MKNDALDNRMGLKDHRYKIPDSKLLMGSLIGKYPIILDGGKTIIFITDKSKEAETRIKYELRRDNAAFSNYSKPRI